MPAAKPEEFRRRAVELARLGEKPVTEIAKDLGISVSGLRRWMAQTDIEDGKSAFVIIVAICDIRTTHPGEIRSTGSCHHRSGQIWIPHRLQRGDVEDENVLAYPETKFPDARLPGVAHEYNRICVLVQHANVADCEARRNKCLAHLRQRSLRCELR
jgi:hypothetical protein